MSDYAVTEYEGRIERILDLKNKPLWVQFGRPVTPWPDENNPPNPIPGDTDVEPPYLYVAATYKSLIRPATDAEYDAAADPDRVMVGVTKYLYVADVDAYTQSARWLYIKATIDVAAGFPAGTFRQVRLFSNLVAVLGHENDAWLLPANVTSPGTRIWTDNCPPEICTAAVRRSAYIVIEST